MLRFHKFKNESKLQTLYSISATWLSTIRATLSQFSYDHIIRHRVFYEENDCKFSCISAGIWSIC